MGLILSALTKHPGLNIVDTNSVGVYVVAIYYLNVTESHIYSEFLNALRYFVAGILSFPSYRKLPHKASHNIFKYERKLYCNDLEDQGS